MLLAAGLLVTGVEKLFDVLLESSDMLASANWTMTLTGQLWDTSALLDDGGALGGTLAGLTGYRAMPSLAAAVVLGLYWLAAWTWLKPRAQVQLAARPA